MIFIVFQAAVPWRLSSNKAWSFVFFVFLMWFLVGKVLIVSSSKALQPSKTLRVKMSSVFSFWKVSQDTCNILQTRKVWKVNCCKTISIKGSICAGCKRRFAVEVRFSRVIFWVNASDTPRCQNNRWVLWEPWHGVCHKTKLPEDALNRQMYGTVRYSQLALVDLHVSIQACECTCRSGSARYTFGLTDGLFRI